MKPSEALALHREEVRKIVAAHKAGNPRVFGSVAEGRDTEESDLDLLVDPVGRMTLFDLCAIGHEIEALLRVDVDVATPNSLGSKYRQKVLAEAQPI